MMSCNKPQVNWKLGHVVSIKCPKLERLLFLYENFSEKCPSNGTGIYFRTENRNGIKLYHLQDTSEFLAFLREEA